MRLNELTTPFERRRVIEYGADGNKVVRHWYEMRHVIGPLYMSRITKNEYESDMFVSAISKCHFSPKWNIVFYWMAYRRYTALYTNLLVGLKPVKP